MISQQQKVSFAEGSGGIFSADNMLFAVQTIGATSLLLFIAWIFLKAYSEYGEGNTKANEVLVVWARAVFILMVLMYLITK